jgi:hypothetical protein
VRRFSPAAVLAVLVIIATGTLAAWERLARLDDLWTTSYGQALLAKILLILPLIALGAYHRYRLLPALETPGEAAHDFGRLTYSAGLEVILMVVVLVAAGILTSLGPPSAPAAGDAATAGPEPLYTFEEQGIRFDVFITPAPVTVGFQEVFIEPTLPAGTELNPAQHTALLYLHAPSAQGGEATPREGHYFVNGTFHWGGALFTEPGTWDVRFLLQGGQGDDYVYVDHTFAVDTRPAG